MHFAQFECVSSDTNAFRFYRYEIAPGFFGDNYLKAINGRIGTYGSVRHLDSGSEAKLFDRLVREARIRAQHGYELVELSLPPWWASELRQASAAAIVDRQAFNPSRALRAARALLHNYPSTHEELLKVGLLLGQTEPSKRRAKSHTNRNRKIKDPAPPMIAGGTSSADRLKRGQLLRDVVARIARELLHDDPLAVDSLLTGLSLPFPEEIDGKNVTFLRLKGDRILSMSLEQFVRSAWLDGERSLTPTTAEKLRGIGISTVADLVKWDWRTLRDRAALSDDDVQALVRACGRYKVYFSMEEVKFVQPVFTA